jgi:SecD/SecF fusion protein
MIDAELEKANLKTVRYVLRNEQYQEGSSTPYPDWTLEIKLPQDQTEQRLKQIQASLSKTPIFPSSNQISGKVADDTKLLAIYALLASMVIIVIYVWIRFQNIMFGVAAVVALIHDVLMTLSFLALSLYLAPYFGFLLIDPFKISLAVMAAMLTIGSYSIYDTIVVFDRIREVRGKSPDLNEKMINDSVNQTLSRTLLTSGTVFIGTLILYVVGGQGIHPFAYTMLIGVVTGTYSTVYIAAPVLLWLRKSEPTQGARKGVEAPQGTTVR